MGNVNDKVMSFFNEEHKQYKIVQRKGFKFTNIVYKMSTQSYSRRLSINGYTIEKAREDYNLVRAKRLESNLFSEYEKKFIKDLDINTFEVIFYNIIKYKIYLHDLDVLTLEEIGASEEYHEYIKFILDDYYDNGLVGFVEDIRSLIQIGCYVVKKAGAVEYDVTDLLKSGYYPEEFQFANYSKNLFRKDYIKNEKIIVLTEGKSDSRILSKAMEILYPEICDYYSFLDFDEHKIKGSVSALIDRVKSFSSAGIANRVVAIADNDTAAHDALKKLNREIIPNNIVVTTYPNIELAENYPTIGPNGIEKMNINGMACSIELYLGNNVLQDENGYIPIQWKGYMEGIKRYQGEIIGKDSIQKKFINEISNENFNKDAYDWSGLKKILEMIINSFKNY